MKYHEMNKPGKRVSRLRTGMKFACLITEEERPVSAGRAPVLSVAPMDRGKAMESIRDNGAM